MKCIPYINGKVFKEIINRFKPWNKHNSRIFREVMFKYGVPDSMHYVMALDKDIRLTLIYKELKNKIHGFN